MLTNLSVDVAANELLEALPDGAIWLSVLAEEGKPLRFQTSYINKLAQTVWQQAVHFDSLVSPIDEAVGHWLADASVTIEQVYKSGQPQVYTYAEKQTNRCITFHLSRVAAGVLALVRDITTNRTDGEWVKQTLPSLQDVIDFSQTGIFVFAPVFNEQGEVADFRFRMANRQLGSYVGQEPAALAGGLGSQWFPDYMTNGLFDTYRKAYLTGRTQRFNFHYDGSGIDVWLDIMASKVGDQVIVTFTDFTNLKRLQQQLECSVADLWQSNANLEQFAYVASHDLQEPLRKIRSFGDLLMENYAGQLGEGGSSLIERMQTAAGRMSALIRDLLAYSRLTKQRSTPKPVDLMQVLNRVLDDLDLPLQESNAVVHVGQLPTLTGDETQLQQLLQNLLTNAVKFRRPGQPPVIRLRSQTVEAAEVPKGVQPSRKAPAYHRLVIEDNGIGFDEKYADRIFQVFQRLHGRSQYEGTGIGLAIVQKVVENHGGAVVASSAPGEGATFTVYLPDSMQ